MHLQKHLALIDQPKHQFNFMSEIIQKVKNLSIGFRSKKGEEILILRNISTNIKKGETVSYDDFYYAMPVQKNYLDASYIKEIINTNALVDISKNSAIKHEYFHNEKIQVTLCIIQKNNLNIL